ncbi:MULTISPECIES: hypothetical protein [unclassified Rhizobium]|uniref:hypothetical protein n=1 Tax=unclassified Rhizobium TaxID=2613769 RepID=UPI001AE8ED17|nr:MULTISPECIES: hypothetical protein [unclassified Rhizobium]MBP2460175.1 hypothetical protein [Rhizobium sp. PvP014]MBP2531534.1 hypothetical protein [Rhizobium sp. PvP099]
MPDVMGRMPSFQLVSDTMIGFLDCRVEDRAEHHVGNRMVKSERFFSGPVKWLVTLRLLLPSRACPFYSGSYPQDLK